MHDDEKKESKCATAVSIAARIACLGLAVAAAALMATASQCTVSYTYAADGGEAPPAARPRTVSYSDFPPFVYLVGAASIAAFLEALAIFLSVWKKGKGKASRVLMPLLGAAVPALLYSAAGAGFAAAADMSYCSAYGRRVSVCAAWSGGVGSTSFCGQVHAAVYLALAAAVAVYVAQVVRGVRSSASGGDSDSESSSSSGGCDHGCHHKH